jgi:hypothetical protein
MLNNQRKAVSQLREIVNSVTPPQQFDHLKGLPFYNWESRRINPSVYDLEFLEQNMFVIPVAFNKEHKHLLAHCKELMEYQNGYVAINSRYNKLIAALRTAVENGEGSLDKEATSHDDLFDAFRLSLMFWH